MGLEMWLPPAAMLPFEGVSAYRDLDGDHWP